MYVRTYLNSFAPGLWYSPGCMQAAAFHWACWNSNCLCSSLILYRELHGGPKKDRTIWLYEPEIVTLPAKSIIESTAHAIPGNLDTILGNRYVLPQFYIALSAVLIIHCSLLLPFQIKENGPPRPKLGLKKMTKDTGTDIPRNFKE